MMEESALDVLSRAATMLQEQSPIHLTNDESKLNSKQLPSTKWKRDRRSTQYGRKSIAEQPPKPSNDAQQSPADESRLDDGGRDPTAAAAAAADDSPLDMSVRQRGLPPSYSQAISDPSFRSTYKATTTSPDGPSACVGNGVGVVSGNRDDLPSGISMCDPIIDEHFRRSLGKAYMTVFNNSNGQQSQQNTSSAASNNKTSFSPPIPNNAPSRLKATTTTVTPANNNNLLKSPPPPEDDSVVSIADKDGGTNGGVASRRATTGGRSTANVSDLMDGEGLSVDDHFAKALGDTWLKLNGKKDVTSAAENRVLKTQNAVVESGSANSLVSI